VAALADYRLILIDQRGRGGSSRPSRVEDHTMGCYVSDVTAVLDDVGVDKAGFWGYSNGTLVGLAFGATHPKRLQALLGTGGVSYGDLTDLPRVVDRKAFVEEEVAVGGVRASVDRFMRAEDDRFPDAIDRNVRETDPLMGALRKIAWREWAGPKSLLPAFASPVLFMVGSKEDAEHETEQAAGALPAGRVVRLPGVGHLGAFYRSEVALPVALPFLRDHVV
jgi:pimeloyl-ACP methyl ester carboxylesterase